MPGTRRLMLAVGALALAVAAGGCDSSSDSSAPDRPAEAAIDCPHLAEVVNAHAVAESAFREVGEGGPNVDRTLRAVRGTHGGLCVAIVVGNADTDSDVVGYRIVARGAEGELTTSGEDPFDMEPLGVPRAGCVRVTAVQSIMGAGDREFEYPARLAIGC